MNERRIQVMSNPSFDIDDILNEINKRREEIEREINSVSIESIVADSEAKQASAVNEKTDEIKTQEPVIIEETAEETAEPTEEKAEVIAEETADETVDETAEETAEEADDEAIEVAADETVEVAVSEAAETSQAGEEDPLSEDSDAQDIAEDFEENEPADDPEADDETDEDLEAALLKRRREKSEKRRNKKKKRKILISVIAILLVVIIGAGSFGYYYIDKIMSNITVDPVDPDASSEGTKTEEWHGMDEVITNFVPIYETTDIYSYRDFAKTWYYNGEPASSTNILNVMLIGEDTRGDEIVEEGVLADSVIIASVNTETGELILSSILRDTYAYYELVPGDESTGTYGKLNEAMSEGNLNAYINAIERIYKVNIDNYVLVNFSNFKQIIDTLGGVTIEMTSAEIREINNNPDRYGDVYIEGDAGVKQLTGEQALAYSRIRYIDSDIYRSERQRTVLLNVFDQLKNASISKLTKVAIKLLPYVRTGFTKGEILSIGSYGFSHGWLGYNIVTHTVPINETKADGTVVNVWTDDTSYGSSTLKVDLPLAAQVLQEKIYGRTNINLAEDRPNFRYLSAY